MRHPNLREYETGRRTCVGSLLLLIGVASAPACGGNDEEQDPFVISGGKLDATWDGFCSVRFEEDRPAADTSFRRIEPRAGDEYLLLDFNRTNMIYVAFFYSDGWMELPHEYDPFDPGFVSNCTSQSSRRHATALADEVVYAEPDLRTELCRLERGEHIPTADDAEMREEWLKDYSTEEYSVYKVDLDAFAGFCGAEEGYVRVMRVDARMYTAQPSLSIALCPR